VTIETKLRAMNLALPPPLAPPSDVRLPFAAVRLLGTRALVSGHGPQNPDGSLFKPYGKVGSDLTLRRAIRRRG